MAILTLKFEIRFMNHQIFFSHKTKIEDNRTYELLTVIFKALFFKPLVFVCNLFLEIQIMTLSLHPQKIEIDLVAQQVEHIPFKDGVLGSNPSGITIKTFKIHFEGFSILSLDTSYSSTN